MPKIALTITDATCQFALGETEPPDWDAVSGITDASCQVSSAAVVATPVTAQAAATFCEGATDLVGKSKWAIQVEGLQDVTTAAGVSMFLFTNDASAGWVHLVGVNTEAGATLVDIVAPVTFAAGNLLGPAGADPLTFSATLPCKAKPTVTHSAVP